MQKYIQKLSKIIIPLQLLKANIFPLEHFLQSYYHIVACAPNYEITIQCTNKKCKNAVHFYNPYPTMTSDMSEKTGT
jgi:hypothetical protein